jgi:hypothetical protein
MQSVPIRSVLLVEETGVLGENHWPVACHWQTLSHNVVSSSPCLNGIQTHNVSGDGHWLQPNFLLFQLIMLMMLSNNWSFNKNYVLLDKKKDTVKFIWIFLVLLGEGRETPTYVKIQCKQSCSGININYDINNKSFCNSE